MKILVYIVGIAMLVLVIAISLIILSAIKEKQPKILMQIVYLILGLIVAWFFITKL